MFGHALLLQQKAGELSRTQSQRGFQRRRTGAISKQGNTMLRWLLVEAAQKAAQCDPALRQDYQRLKFRRGHAVAKVAIARKYTVILIGGLAPPSDRGVRRTNHGAPHG